MTPERLDPWISICVNLTAFILGVAITVFEAVQGPNANAYMIGVGLALVGLPPARFVDRRRRERIEKIIAEGGENLPKRRRDDP